MCIALCSLPHSLPDLQIVIHKLALFCLVRASAKEIPSLLITSFVYLKTLIAPVIHK